MSDATETKPMNSILSALSSYATPASVTTKIVGNVISSGKVKALVRKVLIDPVQSALIPKIKVHSYERCREVFNAIFAIFDNGTIAELLDCTENDVRGYRETLESDSPYVPFSKWTYGWYNSSMNNTKLIRVGNTLIYSSMTFNFSGRCESYDWSIEFISPTKHMYERFVDEIEKARQYIETGFMKKFERRIRVIQMKQGGRGRRINYATVPNTVVIPSAIREPVETVIRSVNAADSVKEKYEVNKTIGVLFHGPHGTGKSTLVRYLAMRLGRTLILTGADDLDAVIEYTREKSDEKYIILIEDIDFKFVDRRKLTQLDNKSTTTTHEDSDENNVTPDTYKQTDTLFQLLDGVLGSSDIMVCATTNYKDRLDPALIRDGRFDHDIEVLGLSYEDALEVCKAFDVTPEEIDLSKFPQPINAATLQTVILKYKTASSAKTS